MPKWFDDLVKENAIGQEFYKTNPLNQGGLAPKLTDVNTAEISMEFPLPWIEWIEEYGQKALKLIVSILMIEEKILLF